ncbi:MAG TPA: GNAT family N-acetyltransferase [Gaiellaceae bacterium]|nr:GNAT family N-acetyltransferase [Gaiellaceae bacterium]
MADPAVTVRPATEADEAILRELWGEFEQEVPGPPGFEPETWADEWADTIRQIASGDVFLAVDADGPVGVVKMDEPKHGAMHVHLVFVRPRARRQGVSKQLLRACVEKARASGAATISLHVMLVNTAAYAVWRRLGFESLSTFMAAPLDVLDDRLVDREPGEFRASTHVQSDDETSVERAVAQFLPRLEQPQLTTNGSWIRATDPVLDRDREAHGRFARELSERLGAVTVALALEGEVVRFRLYERGRMVDEYLSVPAFYGELPKGDELALTANPTLVARLTGADREDVRRVARTAVSPADLPPASELYSQLARLMGLE